ncbi:MAG: pilus assembly protein TadG-related protein [Hyphomicrobiales bacterium]
MRSTLSKAFRRLLKSKAANASIITALSAPLIIGGAALGTETSYWYFKQRKLQAGADAAAFAGGIERRSGSTVDVVRTAASAAALKSGYDGGGAMTVNVPPTSGPNAGKADSVEVIINQNAQRFFSDFFDSSAVQMRARAVAKFKTAANACVLALSASASKAANFSGSSNLTLDGCSVMANSMASDAVNVQGSAKLSTPCVYAVGGISYTSGLTLTDNSCKSLGPQANQSSVADPFAGVSVPSVPSGGCKNSNGTTLQAGRYCSGMSLSGTVNLKPGLYYLEGDLKVNANANVSCPTCTSTTGVTFYMAGGSRITMNGNATINLQAPTVAGNGTNDGSIKGMLFMGDPTNSGGSRNQFNGTANSSMTGNIYFKKQGVDYLGNFSGKNGCMHIVADTVQWTGNTTVGVDCTAQGMDAIPATLVVQLVE